jgi:outer membrane protein assembly factor BamB
MRATTSSSLIYLGIKGTVVALDRRTGAELWRTPLKGSQFVNVVLDGDSVIATARGEIFCLDAMTGRIRWNNPLTGMGWGLVTLAGTSIAPMAQQQADDAQAAAAASTVQ